MKKVVLLVGFLGSVAINGDAASVVLKPTADTTLFSFQPGNNDGKGATLVVGGINKSPAACRPLVRFDLGTNLPPGAVITNVSLKLNVTKEKGASGPIQTGFHRLQQDWIEGAKNNPAGGSAAGNNEATWTSRKKGTANWSAPGGTGDFATTPSATIALDNTGAYTVASSAALIADVQSWQSDPATNFGWILVAQQEASQGSARRLAARETTSQAMTLTIGYTVPPPPPIRPVVALRRNDQGVFELSFPAQSGVRYAVQRRSQFDANPWIEAVTLTAATDGPLIHQAPGGDDAEFFRVLVQPEQP